MTRVLWVAGGRHFDDRGAMSIRLTTLSEDFDELITGAAKGADLTAENVWRNLQRPYRGIPARWDDYGLRAGPVRNEVIARTEPAALLAAPGGKGTRGAITLAKTYGIEILEW